MTAALVLGLAASAAGQPAGGVGPGHSSESTDPASAPPSAPRPPAPSPPPARAHVDIAGDATLGVHVEPGWPVHIEYGLDFGFGIGRAAAPAHGFVFAAGVPVNVYATSWLAFGVRAATVINPDPAIDGDVLPGRVDDVETPNVASWSLAGGPRLRLWDQDSKLEGMDLRVGWAIDADVGYTGFAERLSPGGLLGRVVLGREILFTNSRGNGVNVGIGLTGETGLGAARPYRALYTTLWFHGEGGAEPLRGSSSYEAFVPTTFVMDVPTFLGKNFGDAPANMVIGLGVAVGVGVGELIEPRVRVDTLYLKHLDGDGTKQLAASGGVRVRYDRWLPVFTEALGGYAWSWSTDPEPIGDGPILDLGAGIHALHCRAAFEVGVRMRVGVGGDNGDLSAIMLVLGGGHTTREGAFGRVRTKCPAPRDVGGMESGAR